jgi:RalA-binding protein 1
MQEVARPNPPASSRALASTMEEDEGPVKLEAPPQRTSSVKSSSLHHQPLSPAASNHSSFATPRQREESTSRQSIESDSPRASYDIDTPRASIEPALSAATAPLPSRASPRLSAALLPHTRLSIPTSTVFPNTHGRDVLCFIVTIIIRPPNSTSTTWNVAKLFSAFLDLDTRIKARSGKNRKEWKAMVQALPEGRAWKDFAPSRIDQRKAALEGYLQSLLIAPISDKTDLCEFLCSDPVQAKTGGLRKEGYLTKKGKTLRGWKTRYFVLEGPLMEYFETVSYSMLVCASSCDVARRHAPWQYLNSQRSDWSTKSTF